MAGLAGPPASQFPLGNELLSRILSCLPPSSLAAAEATCHAWRSLVHSHALWRRHAEAVAAADAVDASALEPGDRRTLGARSAWAQARPGAGGGPRGAATDQASGPQLAGGPAGLDQPQPEQGAPWKQRYMEMLWQHAFAFPQHYACTSRARQAHAAPVTSLSRLGARWLLSGAADGSLRLWDLGPRPGAAAGAAERPLCQAQHPQGLLFACLLSPTVAVSASEGGAVVWSIGGLEAAGGGGEAPPPGVSLAVRRSIPLDAAAFTSTGSSRAGRRLPGLQLKCAAAWEMTLAAGCSDGSLRVFDLLSGACSRLLRPHTGPVRRVAHARHGDLDLLLSAGWVGTQRAVLISDADSTLTLARAIRGDGFLSDTRGLHLDPATGLLRVWDDSTTRFAAGPGLCRLPSPAQRLAMVHPWLALAHPPRLPAAAARPSSLPGGVNAPLPFGDFFLSADITGIVRCISRHHRAGDLQLRPPEETEQQLADRLSRGRSRREPRSRPQGGPDVCATLDASGLPFVGGLSDGRLAFWGLRHKP